MPICYGGRRRCGDPDNNNGNAPVEKSLPLMTLILNFELYQLYNNLFRKRSLPKVSYEKFQFDQLKRTPKRRRERLVPAL